MHESKEVAVLKLQIAYKSLFDSGKLSKKAMCDLCVPFRDKYHLTDLQTLKIARDELSKEELLEFLQEKSNVQAED